MKENRLGPLIAKLRSGPETRVVETIQALQDLRGDAAGAVPAVVKRLRSVLAWLRVEGDRLPDQDRDEVNQEIQETADLLASAEVESSVPASALVELTRMLPTVHPVSTVATELRRRGTSSAEVAPGLRRFLDVEDGPSRYIAWQDLGSFPPPESKDADEIRMRALAVCRSDPHLEARYEAAALLRDWTVDAALALDPMMALLRSSRPDHPDEQSWEKPWESTDRRAAVPITLGLRGDLGPVFRALEAMSKDASPVLRARAVVALSGVHFETDEHVQGRARRIEEVRTQDSDAMVRDAAEVALELLRDRAAEAK